MREHSAIVTFLKSVISFSLFILFSSIRVFTRNAMILQAICAQKKYPKIFSIAGFTFKLTLGRAAENLTIQEILPSDPIFWTKPHYKNYLVK